MSTARLVFEYRRKSVAPGFFLSRPIAFIASSVCGEAQVPEAQKGARLCDEVKLLIDKLPLREGGFCVRRPLADRDASLSVKKRRTRAT